MRKKKKLQFSMIISLSIYAFSAASIFGIYDDHIPFVDYKNIRKFVLKNGITIIAEEMEETPYVTISFMYKVGSKYETSGFNGITHITEHMMFKKTKQEEEEDRKLPRVFWGPGLGMTKKDFTTYTYTYDKDFWERALREQSRIMSGKCTLPDFETEQSIIQEELSMGADILPVFIRTKADPFIFKFHSYRLETGGSIEDIGRMKRDDIVNFYHRFYTPNNVVVTIVGNFKTAEAIDRIIQYLGKIPRGESIPNIEILEPEQDHFEKVIIETDKVQSPYLRFVYHTPAYSDRNFIPVQLLTYILMGSQMEIYGDRMTLNKGRLKNIYIKGNKAAAFERSEFWMTSDPGLFLFDLRLSSEDYLRYVEDQILEEIERVLENGVTEEELKKAQKRYLTDYVFFSEKLRDRCYRLGRSEVLGDFKLQIDKSDRIKQVTKEDIIEAAWKYLRRTNLTLFEFLPKIKEENISERRIEGGKDRGDITTVANPKAIELAEAHAKIPSIVQTRKPLNLEKLLNVGKEKLPNGMTILISENHTNPIISIQMKIRAGSLYEPEEKKGLAVVLSKTLQMGTKDFSEKKLREVTDDLSRKFSVSCGYEEVDFSLKMLSADFEEGLRILSSVILHPLLTEEAINKAKKEILFTQKRLQSDKEFLGVSTIYKVVYRGTPLEMPKWGTARTVNAITPVDIRSFYQKFYRPEAALITIAGNVKASDCKRLITRYFLSWKSKEPAPDYRITSPPKLKGAKIENIEFPASSQTAIYLGHKGISSLNPDYDAVNVLNRILSDRLFQKLRKEHGLTYHTYSTFSALQEYWIQDFQSYEGGIFVIYVGTRREKAEFAVEKIFEVILDIQNNPVSDRELEDAKFALLNRTLLNSTWSVSSSSEILTDSEFSGRGYQSVYSIDERLDKIEKKDILQAARKYIDPENYCLVYVGTVKDKGRAESNH